MNRNSSLLVLSLITIFAFSSVIPASSQTGKAPVIIDSAKAKDYYLDMKGTIKRFVGAAEITEDKLPTIDGATVTVFEGAKEFLKVETGEKGKCTFRLPLEKFFKIQVSKKGYVTKYFDVSTRVPKLNLGAFSFDFSIDIFEEIPKLDVAVLKKPIAKVTFDPIYNRFQYDDSYTTRINFELKKMYKNYYEIQKAEADSVKKFNSGEVEPIKKEEPKKGGNQKAGTAPPKGAKPESNKK